MICLSRQLRPVPIDEHDRVRHVRRAVHRPVRRIADAVNDFLVPAAERVRIGLVRRARRRGRNFDLLAVVICLSRQFRPVPIDEHDRVRHVCRGIHRPVRRIAGAVDDLLVPSNERVRIGLVRRARRRGGNFDLLAVVVCFPRQLGIVPVDEHDRVRHKRRAVHRPVRRIAGAVDDFLVPTAERVRIGLVRRALRRGGSLDLLAVVIRLSQQLRPVPVDEHDRIVRTLLGRDRRQDLGRIGLPAGAAIVDLPFGHTGRLFDLSHEDMPAIRHAVQPDRRLIGGDHIGAADPDLRMLLRRADRLPHDAHDRLPIGGLTAQIDIGEPDRPCGKRVVDDHHAALVPDPVGSGHADAAQHRGIVGQNEVGGRDPRAALQAEERAALPADDQPFGAQKRIRIVDGLRHFLQDHRSGAFPRQIGGKVLAVDVLRPHLQHRRSILVGDDLQRDREQRTGGRRGRPGKKHAHLP